MAGPMTDGSAYYPLMDDRARQYERETRCYSRLLMSGYKEQALMLGITPVHLSLERAREVLGISITALSEILGVSRPTLYYFLDGKEPVENQRVIGEKIRLIDAVVQMVADSGLTLPCPSLLRRRDFSGRTVVDALREGSMTRGDISTFIAIEQHFRAKSAIRLAVRGEHSNKELS